MLDLAQRAEVGARLIGSTGGDQLTLAGAGAVALADLRQIHEAWLPGFMAAPNP